MNKVILTATLAGLMTAGLAMSASAADDMMKGQAKCYGIAKAGQNACASANGSHACKGLAKTDNDGSDFVLSGADDCAKAGGSAEPKK